MKHTDRVWVIDDDRSIRWVLEKALAQEGLQARSFDGATAALTHLQREVPDVLLSDIRMPGTNGLELLAKLHAEYPDLPVIIMTAYNDLESTVAAYQAGTFDYLLKPFDIDDAIALVRRALAHAHELRVSHSARETEVPTGIIGQAPAMQEVFRAIGRLSSSNVTVLINGASGTGKELVARALHHHSPRTHQPFIALNMAAIPHELVESELFGHERGAFTGASGQRSGHFEQANGGTLFLDEIGDMPITTQTRLLRVLANGEFYRVGGLGPIRVDVRIIAATHQNLEDIVASGRFREDLLHRLNVIRIHLPSLSDRPADIPLLARHFLARATTELGGEPKILRTETEEYLASLTWPGNVRQLENTCRWLAVMTSGREIHISDLPPELRSAEIATQQATNWEQALRHWGEQELARSGKDASTSLLNLAVPRFERTLIGIALKHTSWRRREAAELLGWGRNTLTRKMKELDMNDEIDAHVTCTDDPNPVIEPAADQAD